MTINILKKEQLEVFERICKIEFKVNKKINIPNIMTKEEKSDIDIMDAHKLLTNNMEKMFQDFDFRIK